MFHAILFEVHSLRLISAHAIVNNKKLDALADGDLRVGGEGDPDRVLAEIPKRDGAVQQLKRSQVHYPITELGKYLEEVRYK